MAQKIYKAFLGLSSQRILWNVTFYIYEYIYMKRAVLLRRLSLENSSPLSRAVP
jgi:hypothetical protein